MSSFKDLLPTRSDYAPLKKSWRADLLAGVTVGIVALPLALAFGVSSGAGAESGLITAIIAGLVAAVFGGSNVQVSGPTGAMVVILGPIVAQHGIGAIATISLMAGLIVLLIGVLRIGRTVSLIPWPVIEGFTLGIAVIIFLQQVPAAFGAEVTPGLNPVVAAFDAIKSTSFEAALPALILVTVVAVTMLVAPKIHEAIPASLLAVVIATVVSVLAGFRVAEIGELPSSLPAPHLPEIEFQTVLTLVGPAFAVAALAAIESLLSARVAASISDTGPYDADRELVGQGLASVASGFFGGMPATGAIARTAVNIRAGAKTRMSAIVHAVLLLLIVYLASSLVSAIPLAALSGVLMITAIRMVSAPTARTILTSTRSDALIFVLTAFITISFDLIYAVALGVLGAGFFALRQLSKSSGVEREAIPGDSQPGDEKIAIYGVKGALFFGTADRVLSDIQDTKNINVVILRMSQLQMLDVTGAQVISELVKTLERRGIIVLIKGIQAKHTKLVKRVGVIAALDRRDHLFDTLEEALNHAREHATGAL